MKVPLPAFWTDQPTNWQINLPTNRWNEGLHFQKRIVKSRREQKRIWIIYMTQYAKNWSLMSFFLPWCGTYELLAPQKWSTAIFKEPRRALCFALSMIRHMRTSDPRSDRHYADLPPYHPTYRRTKKSLLFAPDNRCPVQGRNWVILRGLRRGRMR